MRIDLLGDIHASLSELGESVRTVDWTTIGRVQDWRRYIPVAVRARWSDLSDESKGLAYYVADEIAGGDFG